MIDLRAMQYNAELTKFWWLLYCNQWYKQRWCDKWCYQIVKNNVLKNVRSLIVNFTKKFRNIYNNAIMTNDLFLNDKHVFILDFVIDSRQTNLRLVVDRLLTSLSFRKRVQRQWSCSMIFKFFLKKIKISKNILSYKMFTWNIWINLNYLFKSLFNNEISFCFFEKKFIKSSWIKSSTWRFDLIDFRWNFVLSLIFSQKMHEFDNDDLKRSMSCW